MNELRHWIRIVEGRDAPLYHHMRFAKALDVFAKDAIPASWEHDIPGIGVKVGTSLTRNPRLPHPADVILTLDQSKLARTNRIVPLDAEFIHNRTNPEYRPHMSDIRDREYNKHGTNKISYLMSEEFVIGDIKRLHRYITSIEIAPSLANDEETQELVLAAQAYADKYGLPLIIPDYLRSR